MNPRKSSGILPVRPRQPELRAVEWRKTSYDNTLQVVWEMVAPNQGADDRNNPASPNHPTEMVAPDSGADDRKQGYTNVVNLETVAPTLGAGDRWGFMFAVGDYEMVAPGWGRTTGSSFSRSSRR